MQNPRIAASYASTAARNPGKSGHWFGPCTSVPKRGSSGATSCISISDSEKFGRFTFATVEVTITEEFGAMYPRCVAFIANARFAASGWA